MADTRFQGPGPDAVFEAGMAEGEFRIQCCGSCGAHIHYPRALCPECGSAELDSVRASGEGTVHATSVVRVRPGHGEDYNIALVDLAEGPRMMTRVVDIEPGAVRIGDAVTAFVGEIEGNRVVLFRPAAAPASGGDR
ncbi:MAG: OB-fold domain-containing protein [Defluviicoccus sp.]|nr:OB-fold domain-containing protein [Defluviicoccus sp.]MDE0385602.1 OB-fold domain-containing protein [Defluviicoccus sp.]